MHRFFVDSSLDGDIMLNAADVRHVKKVLRLGKGDRLVVVDKEGLAAVAEITGLDDKCVFVRAVEFLPPEAKTSFRVILGQGLGKGDKMDLIVQKAVELGVTDIVPLTLARSVVNYDNDKRNAKKGRWQKIAVEASKQCRRNDLPTVHDVQALDEALQNFSADMQIICYEEEKVHSLRSLLKNVAGKVSSVFLLIGPEGGFAAEELEEAKKFGFASVSLGPLILRTETAALAALSIIMYEFSGLGGENA